MSSVFRPMLVLFALMTLLTGVIYPVVVTGLARALFPAAAAGSIVERNGAPVGSRLIGQSFNDPKYFWSRPSATATIPYNALASGGSNLGPLNPALIEAVRARVEALHAVDPANSAPIPVDLVTASASGLDPHISVAAAEYQVARIARVRGLKDAQVSALVTRHTNLPALGIIGEPRVNVLELNLALDALP